MAEEVEIAGIRITHPDRVVYPKQGVTKLELAQFYKEMANRILPYVSGRPLSIVRCPHGEQDNCFYQKHISEGMPDSIHGVRIKEKEGENTYLMIKDLPGLIALVQFDMLEIHPWGCRVDKIERPDTMIFDLDPGQGTSWKNVVDAARLMHEQLDRLGFKSYLKTSGGKGLHVVIPIMRLTSWDELKNFSNAIAREVADNDPQKYIATMSKEKRKGKIFIDYLRNSRGATSVAPYSTRAKKGAPVATPLLWDELSTKVRPDEFTIANLKSRLGALKNDPWDDFLDVKQSITAEMFKEVGLKN